MRTCKQDNFLVQFFRAGLLFMAATAILRRGEACTIDGREGIMEENSEYIGVDDKNVNSAMTKAKFNRIIDKVISIYEPIIERKSRSLSVNRFWEDGTVNAYASQTGRTWTVSMFGGLARHPDVTEDAFALVLCHEIGHHLGGTPKKKIDGEVFWASTEGQSDYWGSMKCLRKYFEEDDNTQIMASVRVPIIGAEKCSKNFENTEEIAICKRSVLAGQSLANLFHSISRQRGVGPQLGKTDLTVVRTTYEGHPKAQCRLDTYFSGAICNVSAYDDVSDWNQSQGVCSSSSGHLDGKRPFCWYHP